MKSSTNISIIVHTIHLTQREADNINANTVVENGNSFDKAVYAIPHVYSSAFFCYLNENKVTVHLEDFTTTDEVTETIQHVNAVVRQFTRKQQDG